MEFHLTDKAIFLIKGLMLAFYRNSYFLMVRTHPLQTISKFKNVSKNKGIYRKWRIHYL
jgi:hypothetical protein